MTINLELFGDESIGETAVTYGIVGVEKKLLSRVEQIIRTHKEANGIPKEAELHCRILFHYHSRIKTAFKNFTKGQLFEFYRSLLEKLVKNKVYFRVGVTRKINGNVSLDLGFTRIKKVTNKHLVLFAFISSVGHLFWNRKIKTNLYVDRENTKIDWFGKNRQVQTILQNMGGVKENPSLTIPVDKPLLEVADCLAYSAAKVSSPKERDKEEFMTLIRTCNPIRIEHSWNKDVLKWH